MEDASPSFLESDYRTKARAIMSFANAYHKDETLRSRVSADPRAVLAENGIDVQPGPDVRVTENTMVEFHLVMPPDPNVELSDETLSMVAGGKSASTIGSGGSAATIATACTTGSSASSTSSAGTADGTDGSL